MTIGKHEEVFQTISYSAKTDVSWLSKHNQVVEYLIQREIQEIESMSQLTSIISQTSNEISDTNYQAWERSQQINDKIADDFSGYIWAFKLTLTPQTDQSWSSRQVTATHGQTALASTSFQTRPATIQTRNPTSTGNK